MSTFSDAVTLIEKLNQQVKWGQAADINLCRFCGGSLPHNDHRIDCLKGQVEAFLQEEYQYREDHGPYGDATTPGFFKTS